MLDVLYSTWRDLFSHSINGDFFLNLFASVIRPASLFSLFLCCVCVCVSDWIVCWSTRRVVYPSIIKERNVRTRAVGGVDYWPDMRRRVVRPYIFSDCLHLFSYNSLPFISNKNTSSINVKQNITFFSLYVPSWHSAQSRPHQHLPDRVETWTIQAVSTSCCI